MDIPHLDFKTNSLNSVQMFLYAVFLVRFICLACTSDLALCGTFRSSIALVLCACPYQDFLISVTSSFWQWHVPCRGFSLPWCLQLLTRFLLLSNSSLKAIFDMYSLIFPLSFKIAALKLDGPQHPSCRLQPQGAGLRGKKGDVY